MFCLYILLGERKNPTDRGGGSRADVAWAEPEGTAGREARSASPPRRREARHGMLPGSGRLEAGVPRDNPASCSSFGGAPTRWQRPDEGRRQGQQGSPPTPQRPPHLPRRPFLPGRSSLCPRTCLRTRDVPSFTGPGGTWRPVHPLPQPPSPGLTHLPSVSQTRHLRPDPGPPPGCPQLLAQLPLLTFQGSVSVTSAGGPDSLVYSHPLHPGPSQQASVFPSGYHSPPSEVTPKACFLGVISLAFPLECELQGLRNPPVLLSPVCPAPAAAPRPEALAGSDWGTAQRLSVASGVLGSGPTGCLLAP